VKKIEIPKYLSTISFKDVITLGFLLCVDYVAFGHDYAKLPGRKSIQDYPLQEFRDYLSKLKNKNASQINSFYRLKKYQVLKEKNDKISIDLSSDWWNLFFKLKFRFFLAPKQWSGKWTIIIYDIPEESRDARKSLRKLLKHLGFVQWQQSVWVTINEVQESLQSITKDNTPHIFCFQANSLFNNQDKKIIKNLFQPKQLENKYTNYIEKAKISLRSQNISQIKELSLEFPNLILEDR